MDATPTTTGNPQDAINAIQGKISGLEKSIDDIDKQGQEYQKAQKPKVDKAQEAVTAATQKLQEIESKPPSMKQGPEAPDLQSKKASLAALTGVIVAGLVAGRAAHTSPMLTAAGAMTQYFKAKQENDHEAQQAALKQWEIGNQKIKEYNDAARQAFNDAVEAGKTSVTLQTQLLNIAASQYMDGYKQIMDQKQSAQEKMKVYQDGLNHLEKGLELSEHVRHDKVTENLEAQKVKAAAAKQAAAGGDFEGPAGDLMAALADRGVTLPAGFRSAKQQKGLLDGLIRRHPEMTVDQIADGVKRGQIEFGAQKAETGTAAKQAGKIQIAANELNQFIPLAQQASAKVPRGKFLPYNKLEQMTDQQLSDPDLATLKSYTKSVINAYNQIAGRSGTSVEERKSNVDMLSTTSSPEVYNAILQTMLKEAAAAKAAALEATKSPELNDSSGLAPPTAAAPAVQAAPGDYKHLW